MAINNTKPLTAIERIPYLDHDKLVKQINLLDKFKDVTFFNGDYKSTLSEEDKDLVEATINTLAFVHDLYHEVMSNDC